MRAAAAKALLLRRLQAELRRCLCPQRVQQQQQARQEGWGTKEHQRRSCWQRLLPLDLLLRHLQLLRRTRIVVMVVVLTVLGRRLRLSVPVVFARLEPVGLEQGAQRPACLGQCMRTRSRSLLWTVALPTPTVMPTVMPTVTATPSILATDQGRAKQGLSHPAPCLSLPSPALLLLPPLPVPPQTLLVPQRLSTACPAALTPLSLPVPCGRRVSA